MSRVAFAECESEPLVPWNVSVTFAGLTVLAAENVIWDCEPAPTWNEDFDGATPEGKPLIAKLTVPVKPFDGETEMVTGELVLPAVTFTVDGCTVILKSPAELFDEGEFELEQPLANNPISKITVANSNRNDSLAEVVAGCTFHNPLASVCRVGWGFRGWVVMTSLLTISISSLF